MSHKQVHKPIWWRLALPRWCEAVSNCQKLLNRIGGELWNATVWTWRGHCTQQLMAATVIHTRPGQDQANPNCSTDGKRALEASALVDDLLIVDGCSGRNSHFSSEMWLLAGCPCPSRWLYTHAHMGSSSWSQGIFSTNKIEDLS